MYGVRVNYSGYEYNAYNTNRTIGGTTRTVPINSIKGSNKKRTEGERTKRLKTEKKKKITTVLSQSIFATQAPYHHLSQLGNPSLKVPRLSIRMWNTRH
ncbi:hypothetical protein EYC80_009665 [Monilinia laxa]|uniref:Uncharacterized protein n=1 Tax=Monilinia laxa TaxID=61186 RepID=A0A5N6JYJ3_MONLA|nr:hypothetical protein EYC80_009665 [Monilinia laxa]